MFFQQPFLLLLDDLFLSLLVPGQVLLEGQVLCLLLLEQFLFVPPLSFDLLLELHLLLLTFP